MKQKVQYGVVDAAEQSGDQGAQALVGDAGDGEHAGAQGAGQGLCPSSTWFTVTVAVIPTA
ncbi:MAG TPA: hypothetical protein VGF65_01385 [Mycobacterium sp.]